MAERYGLQTKRNYQHVYKVINAMVKKETTQGKFRDQEKKRVEWKSLVSTHVYETRGRNQGKMRKSQTKQRKTET